MRTANASAPSHLVLAVIGRDPSTCPRFSRPLFVAFEGALLVGTTVVLLVRVEGAVIKSEMINGAERRSDKKKGPLTARACSGATLRHGRQWLHGEAERGRSLTLCEGDACLGRQWPCLPCWRD